MTTSTAAQPGDGCEAHNEVFQADLGRTSSPVIIEFQVSLGDIFGSATSPGFSVTGYRTRADSWRTTLAPISSRTQPSDVERKYESKYSAGTPNDT
jgi:hypothetical protein